MAEGRTEDISTPKDLASGSTEVHAALCQPCEDEGEQTEAEGFCQICKEHLCRMCIKIHKRTPALKRHGIVEVGSGSAVGGKAKEMKQVVFEKCPLHAGQYYKFYCPRHDVFGCGDCTAMDHRTCRMDYIPDVAKDFKRGDVYKQQQKIIEKLNDNIDKCIGNVDEKTGEIEEKAEATSMSVREYSSEIREAIKIREKELLVTTDNLKEENLGPMSKMKKECLSVKNEVATVNEMLKSAESDELNLFMTSCRMKKRLAGIEADVQRVENEFKRADDDVKSIEFQRNESISSLVASKDNNVLGTMEACTENTSKQIVLDNLMTSGSYRYVKDIDCFSVDHRDITGMEILSRGKLLACTFSKRTGDYYYYCALINEATGECISKIGLNNYPYDVTVISKSLAAVSISTKVFLLGIQNDNMEITGEIVTANSCYSIANIDQDLILSFSNPPEVQIGRLNEGFMSNICSEPFKCPNIVCAKKISGNKYCYVLDTPQWKYSMLKKLCLDGKVIAKYSGWEFGGNSASGMDVTEEGHVFLSNNEKNVIQVITPDLKESSVILTENDGIKEPKAVAFCHEEKKLYVVVRRPLPNGERNHDAIAVFSVTT